MNEECLKCGLLKDLKIYLAKEQLPAPTPQSGVSGSGSVSAEEDWCVVF